MLMWPLSRSASQPVLPSSSPSCWNLSSLFDTHPLLGHFKPFGTSHPLLEPVIPFGTFHPFWNLLSFLEPLIPLLESFIPFWNLSSHLEPLIPLLQSFISFGTFVPCWTFHPFIGTFQPFWNQPSFTSLEPLISFWTFYHLVLTMWAPSCKTTHATQYITIHSLISHKNWTFRHIWDNTILYKHKEYLLLFIWWCLQ